MDQGITDVRHIPADYPLTAKQGRVARVIRSGVAERDPAAATLLNGLAYPRYYLDFESLQVAVPLWVGTQPYQQLVVQWSCHVETAPGQLAHQAFLAEGGDDPRRAFAEALVKTVGDAGPVFVYNRSFEVGRLRELAWGYPDLGAGARRPDRASGRSQAPNRAVLLPPRDEGKRVAQGGVADDCPDLDYEQLAIGDGEAASGAWRESYHPDTLPTGAPNCERRLEKYCHGRRWPWFA